MHYPKLTFFLLFAFHFLSSAQNCPENINVNTQEDLEELMLQYPDCAHIPGNVFLKNFTDLSPLSGIITIGGDLKVTSAYTLTHLNGLTSLSSVGNLILLDSEILASLSGLESLSTVEGYVNIQLANLENLNGLSGLKEVGGNFTIDNNPMIESLTGLENLEEVGGDLNIRTNDALTSVEEMSSLQFVGNVLSITDNESIQIITGFESLHTIVGGLSIVNNDQLIATYGFDTLTTVGYARIDNSVNGLAEVACLNQVTEMGSMRVRYGCQTLRLEKLQNVAGKFDVDASNMTNLIGCDELVSVGGSMVLRTAMSNLPDFPKLKTVGGMLLIDSRDHLTILDGFDQLQTIGIGQLGWGFDVYSHSQVTEISGFSQLEQVAGDFVIGSCNVLESISGFQNLFHVQGAFSLSYNPMLNDCSAFCTFLLNRDDALSTLVWQNGTDMGSPCWQKSTLLDQCAYRPVTVQDVDLNYQFGKQKKPLQGALVELSDEGSSLQSAYTDIEGVAEIRYDDLEEGIIYQLDITFPEMEDELLVRHRVSKTDLLNGFELDYPFSVRRKIDTTTAALDSLNIQLQLFGANAIEKQIPGYDISPFLDFLTDWSVISEDHDEVIESMLRVALGVHHIQEYYLSSKPFSTKFAKVSYDMLINMASLVSIYKKTSGLEEKLTSFVESEEKKGNLTFDGLFARANKKLILSILNQAFSITKKTLLDPFMQSFGNSPEEQQFVATMQRLIFIMENRVLNPDSELYKAGMRELILQWLSAELIQHYYIDYATQDYVEDVVNESLDMQGTFEDVFQHAKSTYTETQMTNSEALFAADLFENNAGEIASVGDILENLSIAITLASVGSLTPVAGPMMAVASGFKGLAGIISGANFLNYGERIVFLPSELGDVVSNLSRNPDAGEVYPDGFLDALTMDLSTALDSLSTYQEDLAAALESTTLSSVSSAYLEMDHYYQYAFLPRYVAMKDIASHVAQTGDSTLRQGLFEYSSRVHQFEMQYLVLQLQLTAIHLDSAEVSYRDSALTTLTEWTTMHDNLVNGFVTMFDGGWGLTFGPYVSIQSVTIPDSLSDQHFEMQVTLENVGPAMSPPFEVDLVPNENTTAYKLIDGEEVTGPFDSLELALGEQVSLEFRVYVIDADSTITLTVDIDGVDGNDLSIPVNFVEFDHLVSTVDLNPLDGEEFIKLFPNPAKDGFTIECLTDDLIRHVHVYRMTGQLVRTTTDHHVQMRGLGPGLYIVEVVMDGITVIKKLVLE